MSVALHIPHIATLHKLVARELVGLREGHSQIEFGVGLSQLPIPERACGTHLLALLHGGIVKRGLTTIKQRRQSPQVRKQNAVGSIGAADARRKSWGAPLYSAFFTP